MSNNRLELAFRTLLVRAVGQAEDGTVASLSALERVCVLVAEQTPSLASAVAEYLWRRKRYKAPLEARDFIVQRTLRHYNVDASLFSLTVSS